MAFNILIVDDSDVMRKVIKRVVKLSGFDINEIYEADNGVNALAVLDDSWIDIVLTDINMPVMTGDELLKKMKENDMMSDVPVVIISTEARNAKIDTILAAGAAGYITKPFKPEDIRTVMCDALGVEVDERFSEEPEDSDF